MIRNKKSPVIRPGIDPGTIRLVAQRLKHLLIKGQEIVSSFTKICTVGGELMRVEKMTPGHDEAKKRSAHVHCLQETA